MELHAVINPAAASGRCARRWPESAAQLRERGCILHEHFTAAPGDATNLARDLASRGTAEILAVGGDGTLNEIVNGVFESPDPGAIRLTLSVLPLGTGHDFARSLGIMSSADAVQAILCGSVVRADVIAIQPSDPPAKVRYCLNVADIGLGAQVAARVNRSSKALGGFVSYLAGGIREIAAHRPFSAMIEGDGQQLHEGPLAMVVMANGRYYGGGMRVAPHASLVDGLMDVMILKDASRIAMALNLLPRVYRGTHINHPAVAFHRVASLAVKIEKPRPISIDGEVCTMGSFRAEARAGTLPIRIKPVKSAANTA
jgi:diacylglycerol kinase (ATP)